MYDTIHIFLPDASVNDRLLTRVGQYLHADSNTIATTGYWKNMRVHSTRSGVSLKGSLPKLVYDNNVQCLSEDELHGILTELSEALNLDLFEGQVKRLDIASTLVMDTRPSAYFPFLANVSRLKRVEYMGESLSFIGSRRSLLFYDKVIELEARRNLQGMDATHRQRYRQEIGRYRNYNLLRYEYQCKRLKSMFPHGLTVSQLFDRDVYRRFVLLWKQGYEDVQKSRLVFSPSIVAVSPRQLTTSLASVGLSALGGLGRVSSNLVDRNPGLTSIQKWRLRNRLRDLALGNNLEREVDLLTELDTKVQEEAGRSLEWIQSTSYSIHQNESN